MGTLTLEDGLSLRRVGDHDPTLWRLEPPEAPRIVRLGAGYLRLVPTLPPEPLVLRFETPLDFTPGTPDAAGRSHALLFAGLPVNLRVEHVAADPTESAPSQSAEPPIQGRGGPGVGRPVSGPPSGYGAGAAAGVRTPFTVVERVVPGLRRRLAVGRVEEPVLARAVDVKLYDRAAEVPAGLAVLPLRFRLPDSGQRSLDRVMLPAGCLSLWAGGTVVHGATVEVDLHDPDELEIRILTEVPRADVSLRFGPPSDTGEFSLRSLMRSLTQLALGAD